MVFYTYLWLREDGTPYYAGKGSGKRAFQSKGHGSLHCPKDRSRIVICPAETEAEALASEIVMIDLFGRKDIGTGILRNLTDGGDGVSGGHWKLSEEAVKNISAGLRGNTYTLGFKHSDETRAKLSAVQKAIWARGNRPPISEAERLRRSFAAKGNTNCLGRNTSPETRAKISAAMRGRRHFGIKPSPESREKMRAAKLGRRRAPFSLETRARMSAARRGNTYAKSRTNS